MIGLWLALSLSAVAQDGVQTEVDDEGNLVVIVWGEDAIRAAREAIERDLADLGYTRGRTRSDGDIVFKPPDRWKSRVLLSREGTLSFTRPVVAYQTTEAREPLQVADNDPLAKERPGGDHQGLSREPGDEVVVAPRFYLMPSKRRLEAINRKVLDEVEPEMRYYRAVLQETAFQEALFELPDRLDSLWRDGTPLTPGETLQTSEARRLAVLDYWATRAETKRGRQVCDTVEVWLAETVQTSEHPVTAAELEHANAQRTDGPQLELPAP